VSAESSGVQARGSEPSTALVVIKVDNCGVHSNDDDCSAQSTEVVDLSARIIPTHETYAQLQTGYAYLKSGLFENELPNHLITLQWRGTGHGYYAPNRREIALNLQIFRDGTEKILSRLVHAMTHVWQHQVGKPGRGGYHNREWAAKMRSIGLVPSDTGEEGGKQTGDCVDQYIEPGGRFSRAVEQLLASGFEITWAEVTTQKPPDSDSAGTGHTGDRGSRSGKRTKYTCPHGDQNAWAKPGANFLCGIHGERMAPASRRHGIE
jgi:predicted SprT family Zn-dependent metalloprotease